MYVGRLTLGLDLIRNDGPDQTGNNPFVRATRPSVFEDGHEMRCGSCTACVVGVDISCLGSPGRADLLRLKTTRKVGPDVGLKYEGSNFHGFAKLSSSTCHRNKRALILAITPKHFWESCIMNKWSRYSLLQDSSSTSWREADWCKG